MYKLGDICDVSSGGTPRRSERAFWDGGTIPWVKISDMTGKYVEVTEEFITDEGLAHSPAKLIQPGAVLYSIFASIGATGILTIPAATNQAIAAVRPKDRRLSTDYLYHWLRAQENAARASSRGVAQNNINLSILRAMEMPLPDYDVQEGIVAGFDAILSRRDSYSDQLVKLDELVKSRFVEMFGDPVTNPMGWPVSTIKETALVYGDGPFGSNLKSSDYVPEGVRVIRLGNILQGAFSEKDRSFVSYEKYESLKRYECKPGQVVIATLGDPLLRACLVPDFGVPSIHKADCMYYETDSEKVLPLFAVSAINHPTMLERAGVDGHGQTRKRINSTQTGNLPMILPPLTLQQEFAAFVRQVDKLKFETQQAIDKLQMLYDSLAQEYFGS